MYHHVYGESENPENAKLVKNLKDWKCDYNARSINPGLEVVRGLPCRGSSFDSSGASTSPSRQRQSSAVGDAV